MASYKTTRFIQIVFVLLIIILVIGTLVYFGRSIFFPNTNVASQPDISQTALLSTNADRAVRMTVRGPIVADEDYRTYQIRVTPNERALIEYKGYQNQQFDNITLVNNIPSYEQFVYALDRSNLMRGTELTGDSNDVRGVCASGNLYQFQIFKADKVVKMLWTTSCSSVHGSINASLRVLTDLIISQIPGAQKKINTLW